MIDRMIQLTMAVVLLLSPGLSMAAGLIQLPVTGQTVCFDGAGNAIPCDGTGQDGDKKAGVPWPTARFTDNGTGTVTDNLTGLRWSKHANAPNRALPNHPLNGCPNAEADMSWQQALAFVTCLNAGSFAGFTDWRLPNLNELESIVNAGVPDSSASLNANGFGFGTAFPQSRVQSSDYWSSTSDIQSPDSAWDVNLVAGDFPLTSVKTPVDVAIDTRGVWPVRGDSTPPAQLCRTGQTACFDSAGAVIPCAGTGQDGEKLAGAVAPLPRFQANAGATFAVDKLTGLIWPTNTLTPGPAACPNTGRPQGLTWLEALDHVKCLNSNAFLARTDWRLPNRKELRSLAGYGTGGPALSAGNPFLSEVGNTFWSSTTNTALPRRAWTVSMFDGSLNGADKRGTLLPAWPVSGPDALPPALTINAVTATTNVATLTISGTVEAGATPTVTVSTAATVGPVTVNGTNWSCVISNLAEGANTINVAATDASANTTALPPTTVTVDTIPPALTMDAVTTPTKGTSQTISGTVEAGITPVVTCATATVGPVTVNGTSWSTQLSGLTEGANDITVTSTDPDGNVTIKTATITRDDSPPTLALYPVTGMSKGNSLTISGTVEAGVTPVVSCATATVGPVTVNGTSWNAQISGLQEGTNSITVTATSVTGKTTALPATTVTVDTIPPALTMDTVATRSKGSSKTISGTVEAGVTPVVTSGTGATVGPLTVSGGKWSCQVSGLKPGDNDITVTAYDAAGNTAAKSASLTVLIADGVLKGWGAVNVTDALKALRIAVSLASATSDDMLHGDVAPPDAQDGKIDAADALLILKKAVGLASF